MRRLLALAAIVTLAACVSNRAALNTSMSNKLFINQVQIGQTMDTVQREMHKGPESQNVSTLSDGTMETVWNYVTDYGNDTNTSITFHGDKVTAINQTRWLGNGDFGKGSALAPSEQAITNEISQYKPADVTITGIDVTRPGVVGMEGLSSSAASIAGFVQHLRGDAYFSGVTVVDINQATTPRRFKLLVSLKR